MTRHEKLTCLRDTFDDAIANKIDIHDWTAQALALIPDLVSRVEIQTSSQGIAAEGPSCPLHLIRVAGIRAALARAIHEPEPTAVVHSHQTSIPLDMAALRQLTVVTPTISTKKLPTLRVD